MSGRPHRIEERHLRRIAVSYVRQSSKHQVEEHTGSTALQMELKAMLERWGWPPERVEVLDQDLGVSGSTPEQRRGFNGLLERMSRDEIGLVAVTDVSRLGRNLTDLARFVETARTHDVLLAHDGQCTDFLDHTAAFVSIVLGANADRENRARIDTFTQARQRKAERGIATTNPPSGYVAVGEGRWEKDPDPRVRSVIELIFDRFMPLGSAGALLRALRRDGVMLPRRTKKGVDVRWVVPTRQDLLMMLRSPVYRGCYVYGAERAGTGPDQRPSSSTGRVRAWHGRPSTTARVAIEGHHAAYVSREVFARIQARIEANKTPRTPVGRGEALVQGILRCQRHDRAFITNYGFRQRVQGAVTKRVGSYWCANRENDGTPTHCARIRARYIDRVVEEELLKTLQMPSEAILKVAIGESRREHEKLQRLREHERLRAEHAVAEAERAWLTSDADLPDLRRMLAERANEAERRKRELLETHRRHPVKAPVSLESAELRELAELLSDFPRVWRHPTVTAEQRKLIVRQAICAVHASPGSETWELTIAWAGGATTKRVIVTEAGVRAAARRGLEVGRSKEEIAEQLNAMGAIHLRKELEGEVFTKANIVQIVDRQRRQMTVRKGEVGSEGKSRGASNLRKGGER